MNHQSNEVKQLLARVCSYLARREINSPELLKAVIPMLVNGTKEKNSYVKANSELSLVAVLRLRNGDEKLQVFLFIYFYFLILLCSNGDYLFLNHSSSFQIK